MTSSTLKEARQELRLMQDHGKTHALLDGFTEKISYCLRLTTLQKVADNCFIALNKKLS